MIDRIRTLPAPACTAQRQALPEKWVYGTKMSEKGLRIGAVSYLNSKPLVEGLGELLPDLPVKLDFPSRLADDLAADQLDVALIPSIEYFRGDNYQIISDACVAAHGPVLSVKLYSRVPWGEINTLALDEGSRTSAALARVMLAERHGVFPKLEPLPLNHRTEDTRSDAILLIGDRAILPPRERFLGTWDLGEEWCEWTGLPFVFAMWVAINRDSASTGIYEGFNSEQRRLKSNPGTNNRGGPMSEDDLDFLDRALRQSRDWGVARLTEIARREAPLLGLSFPTTVNYLTENLQYNMGSAERSGLKRFYELASGLELAPQGVELRFRSPIMRSE